VRVRFGELEFDAEARQVYRSGSPVHLTGKAFELLKLLLERRPTAISKAEIQDYLWRDTFVSEANLPTLVAEIRNAIGDDARQSRFLRTVHGFGYAFSGEVIEDKEAAAVRISRCWLASEMGRIPLVDGNNILGRGEDADVILDSSTVSRHHARITIDGSAARIEDLGSKNGTYVNDEPVTTVRPLQEGDRIRVGSFLLTFHRPEHDGSTSTETVR
jgi:DNA-binding winged helix-turn-helix (wHTH) protein